MANKIDIETYRTDNMDEENHTKECYTESMDVMVDNIQMVGIFMICHASCGKKRRNAYMIIRKRHTVPLGESLDLHKPGKGCSYVWRPSFIGQICYRRCYCRHIKQSAY